VPSRYTSLPSRRQPWVARRGRGTRRESIPTVGGLSRRMDDAGGRTADYGCGEPSRRPRRAVRAGNIEESTLEQLHDHVARLARGYLTGPMLPLFGELVAVRNRAYELLECTQRLSQRSDLYLIVGQLSCLFAGTSCDLGYPQAAIEQARAACTYGDLIGHNGLWAYAHGQLAMFFSLEGQLRRSLRHARLGQQRAAPGSPMLRLRGLEALACSEQRRPGAGRRRSGA
jgi:hypothetical protein